MTGVKVAHLKRISVPALDWAELPTLDRVELLALVSFYQELCERLAELSDEASNHRKMVEWYLNQYYAPV